MEDNATERTSQQHRIPTPVVLDTSGSVTTYRLTTMMLDIEMRKHLIERIERRIARRTCITIPNRV